MNCRKKQFKIETMDVKPMICNVATPTNQNIRIMEQENG